MPILTLQRRIHEVGRIRTGEKAAKGNPVKLSTFRFTSANHDAIEEVARLYGGSPRPWESAPVGEQYQVVTDSDSVPVIVPSTEMSFSQYMELWSGGGCVRRCDGERELLTDAPCLCDPEGRECKPTTRLSVILPDLESLGVWRIESHGWNGAAELAGSMAVLQMAAERGRMVPARLRLEQRQSKKDGVTRNFAVPVLDLQVSVAALVGSSPSPQIHSGGESRPALKPVPTDDTPAPSIREQVAAAEVPKPKPRRANSAPPIPATGIRPRTAAEVAESFGATEETAEPPPDAITTKQINYLRTVLAKDHGVTDNDEIHDVVGAYVGREIGSLKELSKREASTAIDKATGKA